MRTMLGNMSRTSPSETLQARNAEMPPPPPQDPQPPTSQARQLLDIQVGQELRCRTPLQCLVLDMLRVELGAVVALRSRKQAFSTSPRGHVSDHNHTESWHVLQKKRQHLPRRCYIEPDRHLRACILFQPRLGSDEVPITPKTINSTQLPGIKQRVLKHLKGSRLLPFPSLTGPCYTPRWWHPEQ